MYAKPSDGGGSNGEPTDNYRPTLGLAATLAREDVTDPSDPEVTAALVAHEVWAERERRRRRARREDRETLLLADFEDAEVAR